MTLAQPSPSISSSDAPALSRTVLLIMAAACGISAANIYYNQPLLEQFARIFHVGAGRAGLIATAAQVGYGIGLFLFVPLGDVLERRTVVLWLIGLCTTLLLGMAAAPNFYTLLILQLLVGMTATSAQILIPFAVDLSPPQRRGNVVGTLMAGLLLGILLARTVGGLIGDTLGWRATFAISAAAMLLLALVLAATLPHRAPTLRLSYARLIQSLLHLGRSQPRLWGPSIVSGLSFGVFAVFWTTLSFLMKSRFHQGAAAAGLFGLVGVAGALAAPLAGKLSDRRGPGVTVVAALLICIGSFLLMGLWVSIPALIIAVLLMDMGVQSVQVAEQATVMELVPEARSRMNTLYMVARFIGGAAGSALGSLAWTTYRWPGVCATAIFLLLIALIAHFALDHATTVHVRHEHEEGDPVGEPT